MKYNIFVLQLFEEFLPPSLTVTEIKYFTEKQTSRKDQIVCVFLNKFCNVYG